MQAVTLPTGALPHPAMDYAALRAKGLELLGKLGSDQWTDYNSHDPGVTLLEALIFAITELAYRSNFPMEDLLAGSSPLPGPTEVLPSMPVTAGDLQRMLLDLGLRSVRIEEGDPGISVYHHPADNSLRLSADPGAPDLTPVRLKGLHRVGIQGNDALSGIAAQKLVADALGGRRMAGEDHAVALLQDFVVRVRADVEVAPTDDPGALLEKIAAALNNILSPPPLFRGLLPNDSDYDRLYTGPLLRHGFLSDLPENPQAIYVSDLIHALQDLPEVRAVRGLELVGPDLQTQPWVLKLPSGHYARLAEDSPIRLLRGGLPLQVDSARLRAALRTGSLAPLRPSDTPAAIVGKRRNIAAMTATERQLPMAYGVGTAGLPRSAGGARKAQAALLRAYLTLFDQLLANCAAQLAGAPRLYDPEDRSEDSYFSQPISDLGQAELLRENPASYAAWLQQVAEPGDAISRRNRFLAHMLARYGESLGDHARIGADRPVDADRAILNDRRDFLRDIARLGAERGATFHPDTGAEGGLEARLRLKLGSGDTREFLLIEHILLRPVPEDVGQRAAEGEEEVPLLAGVEGDDPWSLQLSVVLQDQPDSADFQSFEAFVGRSLQEELPGHLYPRLHWFGASDGVDHWQLLRAAWSDFRACLQRYRAESTGASASTLTQLALRDARDRVVELLGLGRCWPLRDLPMPANLVVAPGRAAVITLEFSQRGVRYTLCRRDNGQPVLVNGVELSAEGTGQSLSLQTPPIQDDMEYAIRALKLEGATQPELRRELWLKGTIRVEEGVDPTLRLRLLLPALDANYGAADQARIADYGAVVQVELAESQEGVIYELIDASEAELPYERQTALSDAVTGTSQTIVLSLRGGAVEDRDLKLRGLKWVGDPQKPQQRTAVLDQVLCLRVRANPAVPAVLGSAILNYRDTGLVRLTG
ncbi:MAG TPA: hypothetical protein PLA94_12820, partial [Myxococcota bacterium]|nr:hypothetical protein [Myxococcota bacterium]